MILMSQSCRLSSLKDFLENKGQEPLTFIKRGKKKDKESLNFFRYCKFINDGQVFAFAESKEVELNKHSSSKSFLGLGKE